jgi:hypothetical protein
MNQGGLPFEVFNDIRELKGSWVGCPALNMRAVGANIGKARCVTNAMGEEASCFM